MAWNVHRHFTFNDYYRDAIYNLQRGYSDIRDTKETIRLYTTQ